MVARLQTPLRDAVFVDLDGTLIKANSMKIYMRLLPGMLLKKGKPAASVAAIYWIGLRALRRITHKKMKWNLTKIGRRYLSEDDWKEIAQRISREINPDVASYIEEKQKEGAAVFIASAALEEYTVHIGRLLKYDGVAATKFNPDPHAYTELRGNEKLKAIMELEKDRNLRLIAFLTDHKDDLPTAAHYPDRTILVNPDPRTVETFEATENLVGYRYLGNL